MGEGALTGAAAGTAIAPGVGTIIGSGIGLLGDVIGGLFSSSGQKSANKTNIQLAREQRDWNEEMWNKQNAYNSPAAQIARMRAAGLNPALMYSQGNVGNAGDVKGYNPPSVGNELAGLGQGISSGLGNVMSGMMQYEQLKQIQAQTALLRAKATKELNTTMTPEQYSQYLRTKFYMYQSQGDLSNSRAAYQDIFNIYAPHLLGNQSRQGELSNQQIAVNTMYTIFNMNLKAFEAQYRVKLTDAQTKLCYGNLAFLQSKKNLLDEMTPFQIELIQKKIYQTAASGKLLDWTTGFKEAQFQWQKIMQSVDKVNNFIDSVVPF